MKINKITLFTGPRSEFLKIIPNEYMSLTELAMILDNDKKVFKLEISGQEKTAPEEIEIVNLVIDSDDYAGVASHVIINFCNFIFKIKVKEIYMQNPPEIMKTQISKLKPICKEIHIINHSFPQLTNENLLGIQNQYDDRIVGQKDVKDALLVALYSLKEQKHNKPLVLLFYGNSGVGKTETAKFISEVLNVKLFRKQFSMLQNNQSFTYVYGGTISEPSLAKDLLDRESNVILFDEFDKAHISFHNAFYEMFDEGVFNDQNYRVDLGKAIIICTSNYLSIMDIEKNLGKPITSRFDKIIRFDNFTNDEKAILVNNAFYRVYNELNEKEKQIINDANIRQRILKNASKFQSAREINKIVKEAIYYTMLKEMGLD